ncbi:MAG TPA: hypothetical protein VHZ24_23065 [Pirellulales bacterium]|nr:hypothetical protein [Pirellulales bacterium]
MPGQFLRLGQRRTVAEQFGDMRMPAGGMEVGNAVFVFVSDADPFQVFLDHPPGLPAGKHREQLFPRLNALEPHAEHGDQFRMQRQHVLAAVLGIGRLDGDRRRHGIECKAPARQARKFVTPQACQERGEVDACPLLARIALDTDAAMPCGINELGHFIGRKRPPCVPHIDRRIQPLDARQRIARQTLGRDAPVAERPHCLEVLVIGAMTNVVRLPQAPQVHLHGFGVDVGQRLERGTRNDPPHLAHRQLNVLRRVVLKATLEEIEQPVQCRLLRRGEPLLLGIDHAGTAEPSFRFELAGELLGQALIGEALGRFPLAAMIEVLNRVGFVLAFSTLENRSHWSFPPCIIFARLHGRATVRNPFSDFVEAPAHRSAKTHWFRQLSCTPQPPKAASRYVEQPGQCVGRDQARFIRFGRTQFAKCHDSCSSSKPTKIEKGLHAQAWPFHWLTD